MKATPGRTVDSRTLAVEVSDGCREVDALHGVADREEGAQAVLVGDQALVQAAPNARHVCHQNTAITVGGPGQRGASLVLAQSLPIDW